MDAEIKLGADAVTREVSVAGGTNVDSRDPVSFFENFSKAALFDTDILPLNGTGVLAIRHALDHTQVVFQHAPGMYYVNWGAYERDKNAKTYNFAQPWRIVIGDFKGGNLLGARHFYSPVPIQTGDQILHHVNLPNLNCKGYGNGNGVGWICLYHKDDWTKLTMSQKIRRLVERASGVETYNDANMSGTDGPRFYAEQYKKMHPADYAQFDFLWNPAKWQEKSQKEGVEWTVETQNLWIPVLVKSMDQQDKHYADGVPLTLEMAMYGSYSAYYGDKYLPKPINAFARDDLANPTGSKIMESISAAFALTGKAGTKSTSSKKIKPVQPQTEQAVNTWTPPPPPVFKPKCGCCEDELPEGVTHTITLDGEACASCTTSCYSKCVGCENTIHFDDLQTWEGLDGTEQLWCKTCKNITKCPNEACGTLWDTPNPLIEGTHCSACAKGVECSSCGTLRLESNTNQIETRASLESTDTKVFNLCVDCFEQYLICACGLLKQQDGVGFLGDGIYACEPCIDYKNDMTPYYEPCKPATTAVTIGEVANNLGIQVQTA